MKSQMKYERDPRNQKLILIHTPALVYIPQGIVWPPHHYKDSGERPSRVNRDCTVLDVQPIIVGNPPGDPSGLVIIDGHHRAGEAAYRHVGIDAFLAEQKEDLIYIPGSCFNNLSVADLFRIYGQIGQYKCSIENGTMPRIKSLVSEIKKLHKIL